MISVKIFFRRLHKFAHFLIAPFPENVFLPSDEVFDCTLANLVLPVICRPCADAVLTLAILLVLPNGYRPFFWIARNIWSRFVLLGTGFG